MRIATKNDVLLLLADRAFPFAQFCLTEAGAPFKFLFDNTSAFDLDEPLVQGMLGQLQTAGVIDQLCLDRCAVFGLPEDSPAEPAPSVSTWRVPLPPDPEAWRQQYAPDCEIFPGIGPLQGWLYATGPACTDPAAEEV